MRSRALTRHCTAVASATLERRASHVPHHMASKFPAIITTATDPAQIEKFTKLCKDPTVPKTHACGDSPLRCAARFGNVAAVKVALKELGNGEHEDARAEGGERWPTRHACGSPALACTRVAPPQVMSMQP